MRGLEVPGRSTDLQREDLKKQLFASVDANGDGRLQQDEMRSLADLTGFEGTDEEWKIEYMKLCSEHGIDPQYGIPEDVVMELLEDRSESGCYCTTLELRDLLGDMRGGDVDFADVLGLPLPVEGDFRNASKSSDADPNTSTVYFAGANFRTEEPELRRAFQEAGSIRHFQLFRMGDGRSRGMGRVTFSSPAEAQRAVMALNQQRVDNRTLHVKLDERTSRTEAGGAAQRPEGREQQREGKGQRSADGGRAANHEAKQPVGASPVGKQKVGGFAKAAGKGWDAAGSHPPKGAAAAGSSRAAGGGATGSFRKGGAVHGADWSAAADWGSSWETGWWDDFGEAENDCVFFSGAAFETSSAALQREFQEAGRVVELWIYQFKDGRSRGMGVVQYRSAQEARYAVQIMNGAVIDGREIFVKVYEEAFDGPDDAGHQRGRQGSKRGESYGKGWEVGGSSSSKGAFKGSSKGKTAPSSRIFFSGAPFHLPHSAILDYFAAFGEVRNMKLFHLPGGRSRGMGVCTFASVEAAVWVLQQGISIEGRPLFLKEDTSDGGKAENGRGEPQHGHAPPWEHYSEPPWDPDLAYRGRGPGRPHGEAEWEDTKALRAQVWQFANHEVEDSRKAVFFANVPFGITESHLRRLFQQVGQVRNFQLYTTVEGRSRGMGIVEYATEASAKRAYHELHGEKVSGRPIIVDCYKP